MAKIRNLTGRTLVVMDRTFEPDEGRVPQIRSYPDAVGEVEGIPIMATITSWLEYLPPAEPDVYLIVTREVAEAARDRTDLLVPDYIIMDRPERLMARRFASAAFSDRLVEHLQRAVKRLAEERDGLAMKYEWDLAAARGKIQHLEQTLVLRERALAAARREVQRLTEELEARTAPGCRGHEAAGEDCEWCRVPECRCEDVSCDGCGGDPSSA